MNKWVGVMMLAANLMSLSEFKQQPRSARIYMVLGALNVTNAVDIVCPVPVTVGELEAALMTRQLNEQRAWVLSMTDLMDERGCRAQGVKPDA